MRTLTACIFLVSLFAIACKTKKKVIDEQPVSTEAFAIASNIGLYDKPLDTIIKYVTGHRWQLVHASGGITGSDTRNFPGTFYTLTRNGKMRTEQDGKIAEQNYKWQHTRDIFSGDSTYVISGIVQWKVEGIDHDTLRVSDNYVDGYRYSLVRTR